MKFCYEIYPIAKATSAMAWQNLLQKISELESPLTNWKIYLLCSDIKIHYFLEINFEIPPSLDNVPDFLFQQIDSIILPFDLNRIVAKFYYIKPNQSFITIKNLLKIRKNFSAEVFEFKISKTLPGQFRAKAYAHAEKNSYQLLPPIASQILAVDFEKSPNLSYKSPPKYLDTYKALPFLSSNSNEALLAVDVFPFFQKLKFLDPAKIDFAKHSLILGASGAGKSKFLSSLVEAILKNQNDSAKKFSVRKEKYKFIVIDPHAALEAEIGGLGQVIDFLDPASTANLFSSQTENIIVAVELLLDILKGLISENYNSKLERVLRHSLYLLLVVGEFNFQNLRKLLLELDYCTALLSESESKLPDSVKTFFYAEFSEIKTRSYTEAISPIIALVDEIEMIPALNNLHKATKIEELFAQNSLTIFSLDRTKFGDRVVKIISGLIMQQILTLAEQHTFSEHIILIIDEVAVIENPILGRFLSEARKYHLSVILAGQYFGGISMALRQAIFANVVNYYIFRIAKDDANLITENLDMKIPLDDTKARKIKTLTELQNRECIIRISAADKLIPAIKCTTLDFIPHPRIKQNPKIIQPESIANNIAESEKSKNKFCVTSDISLQEILKIGGAASSQKYETSQAFITQNSSKTNPEIFITKSES